MTITAEIKTGERSVMSYLLSPLEESVRKFKGTLIEPKQSHKKPF